MAGPPLRSRGGASRPDNQLAIEEVRCPHRRWAFSIGAWRCPPQPWRTQTRQPSKTCLPCRSRAWYAKVVNPCRATPRCTRSLCNGHLHTVRLRRRPQALALTAQAKRSAALPGGPRPAKVRTTGSSRRRDPARLSGAAATRRERLLAPARGRTVLTRPSRWESLDPCDRSTPDRSGLRGYPGGDRGPLLRFWVRRVQ